ncbi:MAG: hypothetical protein ABSG53_00130 [Thermoguttaceae bacterium]|jgi:hypothetical protein
MSTVCDETAPCEEQEEPDFPLPFSELPPDLQERAIKSFRDSDHCWDYDDSDFLQENLGESLTYEFGVKPEYDFHKGKDGKTRRGNPKIYWDQYNYVEFEVDEFDLDEVLKHARNDEATLKQYGTCYFKPEAAELVTLLAEVVLLEAELGVEFNASYRLTEGKYSSERVEWEWVGEWEDNPEHAAASMLFARIDETLKAYYEAARRRLKNVIEDEEAWHYSDECIRDTLENNDCYEFDEEGDLV